MPAGGSMKPDSAVETDTANTTVSDTRAEAPRNMGSAPGTSNNSGSEQEANKALKSALEDARKVLRAVISILKSKLAASNKDIKDVERSLADLDRSLELAGNQSTDESSSIGEIAAAVNASRPPA